MSEKKQDLFELAFDTTPDAINLNRLDDGLYLNINEGFTRITGYTKKEVIGKTSLELGIWKNPQDRQHLVNILQKKGSAENLEIEFVSRSGQVITGLMSARIMQLNNEKIILSITKDITRRKQLEKALREKETHYRQLFNSNRDAILLTDVDRNIIDCNYSFTQMFGYLLNEIKGKKTRYLYDDEKQYRQMGEELKKNMDQADVIYTVHYKKKSGKVFPGETNAFFLRDDKKNIIGFIGIIKDISARQKIQKELQKAGWELEKKASELQELNAALNVLLQKREQDMQKLEENISSNYELVIRPILLQLKNSLSRADQHNVFEVLEKNIQEMVLPFSKKLSDPMGCLTPREIQISAFIKQGFSNKEIAHIFNCAVRTIDTHRDNIREKLGLKRTRINLKSYLVNL